MAGLIHVYVGDGKGKSTASVGLAVRASGWGLPVVFAQFLKTSASGEISQLEKLGITVLRSEIQLGFTFQMNDEQKALCRAEQYRRRDEIREQWCDACLVVLDEVVDAVNTGMLDLADLLAFLECRPADAEVVMTGRDPSQELVDIADYMTEFRKVKHPYDSGVGARRTVEY
jgi:cob(I)alamin adenosyltransferase